MCFRPPYHSGLSKILELYALSGFRIPFQALCPYYIIVEETSEKLF